MKTRRPPSQKEYEILTGGPEKIQAMQRAQEFNPNGQMRRALFIQNAFNLIEHADLKKKDLPEVAQIIHSPSSILGNITPWHSAALSNLQFHFATSVLRQGIITISGKDVDLLYEEEKALQVYLKPLVEYEVRPYSPRICD